MFINTACDSDEDSVVDTSDAETQMDLNQGVDQGLSDMMIVDECRSDDDCSALSEVIEPYCQDNSWITEVKGICQKQDVVHLCVQVDVIEACSEQQLRCKMNEGCVDVECLDVSECPPPPPVAIVDCQDTNVVNVNSIPLCTPEGQCSYESSYTVLRDCSVDNQSCMDGECVNP